MRLTWLLALAAGCASNSGDPNDKDPSEWVPGKGDGAYDLIEAGPAASQDVVLDRRVPAFRVMSYGGTKLELKLGGAGVDGYLIVEGPVDDRMAVGAGA